MATPVSPAMVVNMTMVGFCIKTHFELSVSEVSAFSFTLYIRDFHSFRSFFPQTRPHSRLVTAWVVVTGLFLTLQFMFLENFSHVANVSVVIVPLIVDTKQEVQEFLASDSEYFIIIIIIKSLDSKLQKVKLLNSKHSMTGLPVSSRMHLQASNMQMSVH